MTGKLRNLYSFHPKLRTGPTQDPEALAMSRELRKLSFSPDELQAALFNNWLHNQQPVPRGTCERLELIGTGEVVARIPYRKADDNRLHVWNVSHAEVAAALIRLCLQRSIPLPRTAKKSLSKETDSIALVLELDHEK